MKNIIRIIISNLVFIALCGYSQIDNSFEWYIKAVIYLSYALAFLWKFQYISCMHNKNIKAYENLHKKRSSKFYRKVDGAFDFIWLGVFAYCDYKALFIIHIIDAVLNGVAYLVAKDYDKENKEEDDEKR